MVVSRLMTVVSYQVSFYDVYLPAACVSASPMCHQSREQARSFAICVLTAGPIFCRTNLVDLVDSGRAGRSVFV